MASLSNKERVGRALDLVVAGLRPWMVDLLTRKYGPTWQAKVRQAAGQSRDAADNPDDPSYLFWVFDRQWNGLFRDHASYADRRSVSGLWDARRDWAHAGKFSDDQTERVLGDAEALLRAVGGVEQADQVSKMRTDLRRIRYEKDQRRQTEEIQKGLAVALNSAGLPAWRDIVEPHDDVAQGTYQLAEFAADLRQVHLGVAREEYADPEQFYNRTYLTRGLQYLLTQTLLRLNGQGGEPVIDLMTTFGGGKTHSEIAVYHLASGTPLDQLAGVAEVCAKAQVPGLPTHVNRAVIVGNDLSILGSTKPDGTVVRTMWGELAWQLGGRAGYDMLARYDEQSAPPPTSDIAGLLEGFSPCVVLVDEWVAYMRQLYSRSGDHPVPAGTFEDHQTFAQSLTEAFKQVDTAILVVSLPASDSVRDMGEGLSENLYEIGGTPGLESLRSLRSVVHRVEASWQPATVDESFEIVRRRIFKPLPADKEAARNLVVGKFIDHYEHHRGEVASEALQPGYRQTMKASYPIHPELFDRLYQDWSTLERFQRTRGVLRLMATVVHALWVKGDASPLILPASIPLDDTKVFEEITSHLDDPWKPVVDTDIAGPTSTAATIDREIPILGRTTATQRAARCVFLGTAPAVNRNARQGDTGPVRGTAQKRVVLGSTYPGDNPAHIGDALRQLGDRGAYMNRDQDRYWLSLQQTVSRIVRDRAEGYDPSEVHTELTRRLRTETDTGIFKRVHRAPATTADVDDEPTAGLVVFGMDRPHSRKANSTAEAAAREFLASRGAQPRIHKNTLVFLAPDLAQIDTLDTVIRQYLAWQSIRDNAQQLNLDQHNLGVVETRLRQADQAVKDTIKATYKWILIPNQEPGRPDIEIDTNPMDGDGTLAARVTAKATNSEFVVATYAPTLLRARIDALHLWKDQPHISVETLAGYFADYLYMPRVQSTQTVCDSIAALHAVLDKEHDGFAYADSYDEAAKRYRGLTLDDPPARVSLTGLVVDPVVARTQLDAENQPDPEPEAGTAPNPPGAVTPDGTGKPGGGTPPPHVPQMTRFHATKELNPTRVVRDMSQIADEILSLLTTHGITIKATIDLESHDLAALPPDQVDALKENLNTLGFTDWNVE